jgi:hypothetical protein
VILFYALQVNDFRGILFSRDFLVKVRPFGHAALCPTTPSGGEWKKVKPTMEMAGS